MGNMQGIEHALNKCTRQTNKILNLNGEVWKHL